MQFESEQLRRGNEIKSQKKDYKIYEKCNQEREALDDLNDNNLMILIDPSLNQNEGKFSITLNNIFPFSVHRDTGKFQIVIKFLELFLTSYSRF